MTQELNQELTKANLTQAIITGLQGQADILLAEKITSKADYEAVDRFRKDVKNYRLAGEKIFEHEIAERNRLHKEAIAKKKEVLAPIVDVENKAKARVFEWEYEQEQKAKQAEEERLREIEGRKTALMELGYMLKEGVWTLEAVSVDAEEVMKASYEKWTNLFRSLRMHGEEVAAAKAEAIRLQEEEAARLLMEKHELEAREAAMRVREKQINYVTNETRKNELLAMGALLEDFDRWDELYLESAEEWILRMELCKRVVKARKDKEERDAAASARQELIDTRVARLKEAGWVDDGDDRMMLDYFSEDSGQSYSSLTRNSLATDSEESVTMYVDRGVKELARRQAAKEEAIRQQERDRIAKEAADKAEAERLATEQRLAIHGDQELVRQCLVVVSNAGTKLKDIVPQVKTTAVKDKVQQTMDMLREAYVELNKLQ